MLKSYAFGAGVFSAVDTRQRPESVIPRCSRFEHVSYAPGPGVASTFPEDGLPLIVKPGDPDFCARSGE